MDLAKELLKEYSKRQCNIIIKYVGTRPDRFAELVNVFVAGPYRVTQRASWPLTVCCERAPELIRPHLKTFLKHLKSPRAPIALKRNVVRTLQFIDVPKAMRGDVVDVCFRFFKNKNEALAVRIFSMTVLANLATPLPDLKNELIPLIEDEMPYGSAGFISRARKILKELKK